jgi:phytoene synthase
MSAVEEAIFRDGSVTYYWAARLFPRRVRTDVLHLYSFLRVADDYVDSTPPKAHQFQALKQHWQNATLDVHYDPTPSEDDTKDARVIKNIIGLTRKHAFDQAWVEAFWASMQMDLDNKQYPNLDASLEYVYGSAEVVGLMMAKIMGLTPEAYEAAKLQGRAMQWINFIRDLGEDIDRGRCYFSATDLAAAGLPHLNRDMARAHPAAFKKLIHTELGHYHEWQAQAREGFKYIPGMLRPALKTAVDMFDWTAKEVAKDPFIVFEHPLKPTKRRVFIRGIRNLH